MTLETLNVQRAYAGDGVDVEFPIDFDFWETSEVQVFLRVVATGVETLQIEGVDYTVTNHLLGSTGDVDFTIGTVPPGTDEVHVRRTSLTTQTKDLTPSTVVPTEAIEEGLDRLAARFQEVLADMGARSLTIPVTDIPVSGTPPDMELPNLVARAITGAVLGFDLNGNPIVTTAGLDTALTTAFTLTLLDDADAAEARATLEAIQNGGLMSRIQHHAAFSSIIAAGTFGTGIQTFTDTREIFYSDGVNNFHLGVTRLANASLPASVGTAGRLFLDSDNVQPLYDDGTSLLAWRTPLTRGAIGGLGLSLSGSDQDVNIAVGECRGGTSANRSLVNGFVTTALVKMMDGAGDWVAGPNALGRPSGDALGIDKWHHIFLLIHQDGSVDSGIDDDPNAATLLASSNVQAAGFDRFRYLGSVKETGAGDGTLLPFIQFGDLFLWTTVPGLSHTDGGDQTYQTQANIALEFVPPDFRTKAHLVYAHTGTGQSLLGNGGTIIPAQPVGLAAPLGSLEGPTNDERESAVFLTDTSQQVVYRSDDNSSRLHIEVHGYENARGRWD